MIPRMRTRIRANDRGKHQDDRGNEITSEGYESKDEREFARERILCSLITVVR